MIACGASRDVTAKGSSPAVLNRRHHFELRQVQVRGTVTAIGRPAGAEDIRDLQFGTGHLSQTYPLPVSRFTNRSSGLVTSWIVLVATLV